MFNEIGGEKDVIEYIENSRLERVLFLSKLPASNNSVITIEMDVEECLTRLVGFFVI